MTVTDESKGYGMTLNEYQQKALETAFYPTPIIYPALGMCGESGEVADTATRGKSEDRVYSKAIIDMLIESKDNADRFLTDDFDEIRYSGHNRDKKGKLLGCKAYFAKRMTIYKNSTDMKQMQNDLAYLLADKLFKSAYKFKREHPKTTINAMIGAANMFLTQHYVLAPTKEAALKSIEEDFEIIRNMLKATPDTFFGKGADPNLN